MTRTGEGFNLEGRIRCPDGALRDVLCKAESIRGGLGEVMNNAYV